MQKLNNYFEPAIGVGAEGLEPGNDDAEHIGGFGVWRADHAGGQPNHRHVGFCKTVAVKGGGEYFLYQLERMDEPLRAAAPFLMGDRISPADVLFASCLAWALRYGLPLPQHLMDYHQMMTTRPAYQKAMEQNVG